MTLMALGLKSAPEDAFKCSMGTKIDILFVGNCLLKKKSGRSAYKNVLTASLNPPERSLSVDSPQDLVL